MIIAILGLAALFGGRMAYLGSESRSMNPPLSMENGKFIQCPDKPNCVSSQGSGEQFVKPINSELSLAEIKEKILEMPSARLADEGQNYAHFTFKSSFFGFVDDLEVYKNQDILHVRSASRVGYSDMGKNKERVQALRELLE